MSLPKSDKQCIYKLFYLREKSLRPVELKSHLDINTQETH